MLQRSKKHFQFIDQEAMIICYANLPPTWSLNKWFVCSDGLMCHLLGCKVKSQHNVKHLASFPNVITFFLFQIYKPFIWGACEWKSSCLHSWKYVLSKFGATLNRFLQTVTYPPSPLVPGVSTSTPVAPYSRNVLHNYDGTGYDIYGDSSLTLKMCLFITIRVHEILQIVWNHIIIYIKFRHS